LDRRRSTSTGWANPGELLLGALPRPADPAHPKEAMMKDICTAAFRAGLSAAAALALIVAPAAAQDDTMTPIEKPAQPTAIALGTGPLPGATTPESWHSQYGSVFARNVTEATLTPFLPPEGKGSGAAVIVAPGGGFRSLSMENEGWDVARALAERGVAACVLKYRLNQTPRDLQECARPAQPAGSPPTRPARPSPDQAADFLAPQVADARAAFDLVRSRAAEWKVDTDRIGMI